MKAFSWIFLAFAFTTSPATGGEWIRLSNAQVELYSTNSEAQSRELIAALARVQSFLSTLSFMQRTPQEAKPIPVRIIALSSKEEYAPFRLSPSAFGYYRHSPSRDYIVLQDLRPEHRQAAIHEYMHLAFHQAGLVLPLWFNEGLADFYSFLQTHEERMEVGQSLPARLRCLRTQEPVALATLFAVDSKSSFYSDSDKIPIFYAESWALVHMLAMNPGYQPGFTRFITLITQGISSAVALSQVYGRSMLEIQDDLFAYLPSLSRCPLIVGRTEASTNSKTPASLSQDGLQAAIFQEEPLAPSLSSDPQSLLR